LLNSSGGSNTALGTSSVRNNTTGNYNVGLGQGALYSNTTASNNTAVGFQAGYANTTGYNNLFAGVSAGDSNTTGALNALSGSFSGATNTTGSYNTAYGAESLYSNTTASANTAVGYQAGYTNTTGSYNTFVGRQAGFYSNNTGNVFNAFFGQSAGFSCTTGSENTFIGTNAGDLITTGSKNTILGRYNGNGGGLDIRTSSNNVVLSDGDGNIKFSYESNGNTTKMPDVYTNTAGNAANVVILSSGTICRSTSSLKYKRDVQDATHGLAEVLQLRPVTYRGKNAVDGDTVFGGLIAEEVHDAGLTEFVQYADDETPDALAYGNMVSLCIKAIQEQQATITALTARITALEGN
jgi:hypothetical protein